MIWTETIMNNDDIFMHNFFRLDRNEDIMILEMQNDLYTENKDNFNTWDYDKLQVKDNTWIPDVDNLIVPGYVIDKNKAYLRKNALLTNKNDCCVIYLEAAKQSQLIHCATIHKIIKNDSEIVKIYELLP